jgi:hypothetical protein
MDSEELRTRLETMAQHLLTVGYSVGPLVFGPPAPAADIRRLEADLKVELPSDLRSVLTLVSAHVEFLWFAPQESKFPEPFDQNFSGDLHWSLDMLRSFNSDKDEWIRAVFPNCNDPYDRVWHHKRNRSPPKNASHV